MPLNKFLMAAATAATLLTAGALAAGASAADAAPWNGYRHGPVLRPVVVQRVDRRVVVDHRVVFDTLRVRHVRYVGNPYFVRGHYVVKSFDRFGHATFVEVNPYTGAFIGFIRL